MKYLLFILTVFFLTSCVPHREEKINPIQEETQMPESTPQKTAETKAEKEELISESTTKLYDKSENRIFNIKLAAESINETVLLPGDKFSFNDLTGERTAEKGYKTAAVFFHEEKAEDIGGGVCQLSSTIYMAAKKCGLEILERHAHQKKVIYADEGEDSAVNYGTLDFVFKNNTDVSLIIRTGIDADSVTAQIYRKIYQ